MTEYIEKGHIYLNSSGIIIPSVTQLVNYRFDYVYKDVPQDILKRKARYGSKVHSLIEQYENNICTIDEIEAMNIDPKIQSAVRRYAKFKEKNHLQVDKTEQMVEWNDRYAGRYDILTKDGHICDIKTTAVVHEEMLQLQLGLYYMAAGIKKDVGYCIWLPTHDYGGVIEIKPWTWEECEVLVKEYEEYHAGQEGVLHNAQDLSAS